MSAVYCSRWLDGDKRRAWEAVISQLYASLEVQVRDESEFEGVITQCSLEDLDLTRAIVDYEIASRKRQHIARDVSQSCVFLFVRKGPLTLEQFGREALLDSNSCSIVDLGSPYVLKHASLTDTFFLKAPEVVLRSRFKDIHSHCAVARPIGPGMGRIAADLIASLSENASRRASKAPPVLQPRYWTFWRLPSKRLQRMCRRGRRWRGLRCACALLPISIAASVIRSSILPTLPPQSASRRVISTKSLNRRKSR